MNLAGQIFLSGLVSSALSVLSILVVGDIFGTDTPDWVKVILLSILGVSLLLIIVSPFIWIWS